MEPLIAAYVLPLVAIWAVYLGMRLHKNRRSRAVLDAAVEAGLNQPASLHPKIDPAKCVGCGACTRACPEGDVLGLINGKAVLIEPSECIGHGACRAACPRGAITLVFGTEQRGIDLPHVGADFQTNVPGIFIAGELGGMGLIRNAIEQGRQAIDRSVVQVEGMRRGNQLDRRHCRRRPGWFLGQPRRDREQTALSSPSSRKALAARSRISRAANW